MTMSSPQCRADATAAGAPIENHSAGAELSTFERDVVSMHAQLYRHAYHLSQNREDAEDLVQETMMKAYKAFHTFQGGTNLNAWVFRILTNTFINAYRKKKRQPVQCSTEEVTDQGLAKAYAHSTPMGMRSSEDQALDLLPDNDIKAAMQAMPQQFRDVVYYADVEGLRYTEIAAIMNTPKGTVVSRLARGRQRLRGLLCDGVGGVGPEALPATG
jgi:RNA polymerase sigma-70 factor (ECF subfamily)